MSYLWWFASFSKSQLDAVVGSADSSMEEAVIETATWDDFDDDEIAERTRLARHLVRSRDVYDGLTDEEVKIMDAIVSGLFCTEGLEQELWLEYESPEGLHPSVIVEMLKRAKGKLDVSLLPILRSGRRLGQTSPTMCEYCVLNVEEIPALRGEVEAILALPGEWSAPYVAEEIEECLRSVLANVENKNKALVGQLS